ncbi:acyl-CoA synthetase [Rhizobium sp. L1K21]|uniref:acyl-CoA synthetase n=1 Tax=Rhizobium sp. L1K21 TaxID=2954933 RepID=UPI002091E676|nr:acyl-CoA synthetase [Rhizobium sp. L1K21]MCO6187456.1 acyl-CoA synthetase [Rhizobium sp. L1K21]
MLQPATSYEALVDGFRWSIPEFYNIGVDICDKWAEGEPNRRALTIVQPDWSFRNVSFSELKAISNQIANLIVSCGVKRGDRVGVLLPQALETAASHIAIYKMGGIAVPLFTLFGPDALEYRIKDAGIGLLITNATGVEKLSQMSPEVFAGVNVYSVDGAAEYDNVKDIYTALSDQSPDFEPVNTRADDPAVIIYTSGTTGSPKGALHAHRVLLGHLPGMEMSHDFFPQANDVIWTPADWAWIGGLIDVLLPALHHGIPVIARRFEKFTGEAAYKLMSLFGVTNAFLPPTALKMMRATPHDRENDPLKLRTVGSGGETLGAELLDWGREVLGVQINEFYGQTECNLIVSSCSTLFEPRPGVMGRAVPGHQLAVVDAEGNAVPKGAAGQLAVKKGDPVMFLNYWQNPEATESKFIGDWMLTGDQAIHEGDGWLRFIGRDDDVITSAGYRIGPGPIEDCILRHDAVRLAAVIGKPDAARTEIVVAFVVLKDGIQPSEDIKTDIQNHVRHRLAAHEFPREIHFTDELPVTTTGKIMRRVLRDRLTEEEQSS